MPAWGIPAECSTPLDDFLSMLFEGNGDNICFIETGKSRCMGGEQNALVVWQNWGPAVSQFAMRGIELRNRSGGASGSRQSGQWAYAPAKRGDYVAIGSPGGAFYIIVGVAQYGYRSSFDGYLLQLGVGKEADPFAIRRKEWLEGSFGSRQFHGVRLFEAARGEAITGGENETCGIRGNNRIHTETRAQRDIGAKIDLQTYERFVSWPVRMPPAPGSDCRSQAHNCC